MANTAKLVNDRDGQSVRLPEAFRMPGDEVVVRREGDRVILEPVDKPRFDADAWLAQFDQWRGVPFPETDLGDDTSILDAPPQEPF